MDVAVRCSRDVVLWFGEIDAVHDDLLPTRWSTRVQTLAWAKEREGFRVKMQVIVIPKQHKLPTLSQWIVCVFVLLTVAGMGNAVPKNESINTTVLVLFTLGGE